MHSQSCDLNFFIGYKVLLLEFCENFFLIKTIYKKQKTHVIVGQDKMILIYLQTLLCIKESHQIKYNDSYKNDS